MQLRSLLVALPLLLFGGGAGAVPAEQPPARVDADSTFPLWFQPGADPLRALRAFEQVKTNAAWMRAKNPWRADGRRFSDPGVAFLLPFFLPDDLGTLPRKPYPATAEGYAYEILEADARASLRALYAAVLTDEEHLTVLTWLDNEFRKLASLPATGAAPRAALDDLEARGKATKVRIEANRRLLAAELGDLRALAGGLLGSGNPALAHLAAVPGEEPAHSDLPLSSWEERQAILLSLFATRSAWEAKVGLVMRTETLPVDDERDPFAHFRLEKEFPVPPFHIPEARLTSDAERPLRDRSAALAEERPHLLTELRENIAGASEALRLARIAEADAAQAYGAEFPQFAAGKAPLPEIVAAAEKWADASHRRVERERDLDEGRLRLASALAPEEAGREKN